MLSIALIGLSLSMDAFAVSVSSGISIRGLKPFHAVRSSLFFGVFQFIMPVAGWFLGKTFSSYIQAFDHWVAFILLALIGGKMIWEAVREAWRAAEAQAGEARAGDGGQEAAVDDATTGGGPKPAAGSAATGTDIRSLRVLLTLAIATSIDALAVGISFSILDRGIWGSAALIGGITFLVCMAGFEFGRRVGLIFERGAQIFGGFILIGIGVKILIEHLGG
jgi:putative Mn2+ efflux pump MntP